jgi:hypothetical protein
LGPGARFEDDGASGWGVDPVDGNQELVAFPTVPLGETVASLILRGQNTSVTFTVHSVVISTGVATSLGSGTVGTLLNITDFTNATNTEYLLVRVNVSDPTSHTIFGGTLFKNDGGTSVTQNALLPKDFLVNDD